MNASIEELASSSSLKIGAVQPKLRQEHTSPMEATEHAIQLIRQTAAQHDDNKTKIDLFVLPELSPIGYSEDTFENHLPTVEMRAHNDIIGWIDRTFSSLAKVKCIQFLLFLHYSYIATLKLLSNALHTKRRN